MKSLNPLVILSLAALALTGCSGDSIAPGNNATAGGGVFGGEIGDADFEIVIETAVGPGFPLQGPFVLRGRNLHYDNALGALVVDLTMLNRGVVPHPEPIGLTFIQLLPDGVTVLNPDNDQHGEGAAIVFAFDNDDGMWTPGEESLPRETQFGVDEGMAVAFFARLDIGVEPLGGSIGGLVWHDADRDGMIDAGEPGLAGQLIVLESTGSRVPDRRWETRTAHDGSYRFDGLGAGHYVVGNGFDPPTEPTTPNPLHVFLVEDSTGVSDFLMANFGCIPLDVPPDTGFVDVGDYVIVRGHFVRGPADALVAKWIDVNPRCNTTGTGSLEGGGNGDDPRCPRRDLLRGPVTGIDRENRILEIMGADMFVKRKKDEVRAVDLDLGDIHIGDRIEALIVFEPEPPDSTGQFPRVAYELNRWTGEFDEAQGIVERVVRIDASSSRVVAFRVLGVTVLVPDITTP